VRFSTENWRQLGNVERYGQGYYNSLMKSDICPFKLHVHEKH